MATWKLECSDTPSEEAKGHATDAALENSRYKAERKVIEAAKAATQALYWATYGADMDDEQAGLYQHALGDALQAVEALLAAEGEET